MLAQPKSNFNSCDDFFELITTGQILAAALEVLGMNSLDEPSKGIVQSPELMWTESDDERRRISSQHAHYT